MTGQREKITSMLRSEIESVSMTRLVNIDEHGTGKSDGGLKLSIQKSKDVFCEQHPNINVFLTGVEALSR